MYDKTICTLYLCRRNKSDPLKTLATFTQNGGCDIAQRKISTGSRGAASYTNNTDGAAIYENDLYQ
jgi:hypothetical protein